MSEASAELASYTGLSFCIQYYIGG